MRTLVILSAKMQAGKDTLCLMMRDILAKEYGVTSFSAAYADKLKDGAKVDMEPMFSMLAEQRERLLQAGVGSALLEWMVVTEDNIYNKKTPVTRAALQSYGDLFRRRVSGRHWVDRCLEDLSGSDAEFLFITDARRVNEVEDAVVWAEKNGLRPITVRVTRETADTGSSISHPSETDLDGFQSWHYVVDNNGTLEQLENAARAILEELLEY